MFWDWSVKGYTDRIQGRGYSGTAISETHPRPPPASPPGPRDPLPHFPEAWDATCLPLRAVPLVGGLLLIGTSMILISHHIDITQQILYEVSNTCKTHRMMLLTIFNLKQCNTCKTPTRSTARRGSADFLMLQKVRAKLSQ